MSDPRKEYLWIESGERSTIHLYRDGSYGTRNIRLLDGWVVMVSAPIETRHGVVFKTSGGPELIPIAFAIAFDAAIKCVRELKEKAPNTVFLGVRPAGFNPSTENADLTPDPEWKL